MTREPQRATLAVVAREAGVSVPTVSKVVNGRTDVAAETRRRIEALLVRHGYVARGLGGAQPETRTVEVVFDAMRTPNNLDILFGALEVADAGGVEVVVGTVPEDPLGAAWARRMATARREGLILVTSEINSRQWRQFAEQRIPVVTIDPINLPGPDVPSVGATNFNGGMAATEHLLDLGHRRIGFIEGPAGAMVAIARLHGYHAALAQRGLTSDPALMAEGPFTFEAGFAAALELLGRTPRPTALFASNDGQALGAIEAARTLGLRVPEDVSVVGFDDITAAQWSAPPLTTVRQPFAEMGRVALRRLLRLVAGEELASPRVELATQLIVRKSTAAADPGL
ncbi:transcriptional regulator [Paractinoplanes abujensis]|uniref:LacI family transcriptional regulator n=1 Tax=Paractinoplanes abujensis TaxID=882441 RepID=A0A7W7CV35_9ACTN|nr:LacI family DNA-binding transcriptional regulator [Actinoplanes abujensis]MBB4693858.1 LacI family transcriptional regulator [Actinoplanes abujensis]GID21484.1 transcriptional regulator [Actinoplanes abujensis]